MSGVVEDLSGNCGYQHGFMCGCPARSAVVLCSLPFGHVALPIAAASFLGGYEDTKNEYVNKYIYITLRTRLILPQTVPFLGTVTVTNKHAKLESNNAHNF